MRYPVASHDGTSLLLFPPPFVYLSCNCVYEAASISRGDAYPTVFFFHIFHSFPPPLLFLQQEFDGDSDKAYYQPNAPEGAAAFTVEEKVPTHPSTSSSTSNIYPLYPLRPSYPILSVTLVFHLLFKVAALTTYLLGAYVLPTEQPFVLVFILTIIFIALDVRLLLASFSTLST